MKRFAWLFLIALFAARGLAIEGGYAVVISKSTLQDPAWRAVADALVAKHAGKIIVYEDDLRSSLKPLREMLPRYTCFVATPAEASREFVASAHRLTRDLNDDPYTDTIWGILTGYDSANALKIARQAEPLVVRKVAAGTEVALDSCEQGLWYCELVQHRLVRKEKGGVPAQVEGPADTTKALVDALNEYQPDLFVTSGHATERDWQIGFRYRNGSFRSKAGVLTGIDTQGHAYRVDSQNPKVYLPVGNCLMGHIDGPDAMALAWMNSASVCQMIGYTVPTWYGYAGWGCLDYFVEQPGRYSLAETFIANELALEHRLASCFPDLVKEQPKPGSTFPGKIALTAAARELGLNAQDARGLLHDRDVLAFYGDPAWDARLAPGPLAYDQQLTHENDVYTLRITPLRGDKSFQPINANGSQRGFRPIIQFFPCRVKNMQLIEGDSLHPVLTGSYLLVPNPRTCDPAAKYVIRFRAEQTN